MALSTYSNTVYRGGNFSETVTRKAAVATIKPGYIVTGYGQTGKKVTLADASTPAHAPAYVAGLKSGHDPDTVYGINRSFPCHPIGSGQVVMCCLALRAGPVAVQEGLKAVLDIDAGKIKRQADATGNTPTWNQGNEVGRFTQYNAGSASVDIWVPIKI